MAKSDAVGEGDGGGGAAAVEGPGGEEELRRELQRLARRVAAEEDVRVETLDRMAVLVDAIRTVSFGRPGGGGGGAGRSKSRRASGSPLSPAHQPASPQVRRQSGGDGAVAVPEHFLCPISCELMRDPVVIATGQTYDRPFIEAWLNAGNRTCPRTQQVLSHSILTPNGLVFQMISEWCRTNGIEQPSQDVRGERLTITQNERVQLNGLLEKMSLPLVTEQKQAAKELRQLTKRVPSFRALLGERPSAITQLASLLSSPILPEHPELQEDVVTTIFNLSIHDGNKKIVGEDPQAIPLLIDALKNGTMATRSNAAAALFTLSALDENKQRIGELGAMKPLLQLLEHESPVAKKDAASAIFNLCVAHENRGRAINEGVVRILLMCMKESKLVDESLAILALLSSNEDAVEEMCNSNGVPCMLDIIRADESGARNRENAAVVLYSICTYDRSKLKEVAGADKFSNCISSLAQNGSPRARRKAAGMLARLNRSPRDSLSSCGTP